MCEVGVRVGVRLWCGKGVTSEIFWLVGVVGSVRIRYLGLHVVRLVRLCNDRVRIVCTDLVRQVRQVRLFEVWVRRTQTDLVRLVRFFDLTVRVVRLF